jgi:hypothetical protein
MRLSLNGDVGLMDHEMTIRRIIYVVGILASLGLGSMWLPTRMMALPMEEEAGRIIRAHAKSETGKVEELAKDDDVSWLVQYAELRDAENTDAMRAIIQGALTFFVLFTILLLIDLKRKKPNTTSEPIVANRASA